MELELEKMLQPVTAESPSGENPEYDTDYISLDELATGVPESQMGESVVEGKEPDWRQLQKKCLELWGRCRDLRVASYLSVAGLALHGLKGLADGLELIRYLFSEQWELFWPQLDPDDDNDPLERMNIITMISPPPGAYNDPLHFISLFRSTRLSPVGASYTLRDLMIADGELENTDESVDEALLNAEMMAVPLSVMAEQAALVERVTNLLQDLAKIFEEKTGSYSISFAALAAELKRLKRFYGKFTQGSGTEASEEGAAESTEGAVASPPAKVISSAVDLSSIKAKNRSEALMLLRKGCEYFQAAEPTSPVPYLINRALRMAEMNFMDLLAEIDPNSIDRGRDILGVKNQE